MSIFDVLRTLIVGYPTAREFLDPRYPAWLQQIGGLHLSLWITGISLILATPPAALLAVLRSGSRPHRLAARSRYVPLGLSWMAAGTVEVIRGVPVMLLVLLVFYLPYPLLGIRVPPVVLATGALTLYACPYLSEVFRSGLRAVEPGTVDAARVLGLNGMQVFVKIRAPIAVRTMLPALLGLAITIFKDTSVLTVVAVPELTYTGRQILAAEPMHYFWVLFLLLVFYWAFASLGEILTDKLDAAWRARRRLLAEARL
jgi:polar amino acid transport system permease protein